jgi:putative nucleotidyltransferase with HDIG domain
MIKLVPAHDLKVGMYVHHLNCEWMAHPFVRPRFKLACDADIEKIRGAGINEIYIDTTRGLDAPHAQTEPEARAATERAMRAIAQSHTPARAPAQSDVQAERTLARRVAKEAEAAVSGAMHAAKSGRALAMGEIGSTIDQMTTSITRNPSALLGLVSMKDRDQYTFQHSVAVSALLIAFARHEHFDDESVHDIGLGGLLHDIGKMRVPDHVLNKPGRYNDEEFLLMQAHAEDGHRILKDNGEAHEIPLAITLQHHERMDGSGYPYGLSGSQISRVAQMAAIVDVYDAITAERCYHAAIAPAEALRSLLAWSQRELSPYFVQSFIRCVGIYPVGTLVRLESGLLAIVEEHNAKDLLKPRVRAIFDTKHNGYIAPKLIDLARPVGHGGGDTIVGHESPHKWRIDLAYYLS